MPGPTRVLTLACAALVLAVVGLGGLGACGLPGRSATFVPRDPQTLPGTGQVYFVPLGAYPAASVASLAAYYEAKYGLRIRTLAPLPVPPSAFIPGRNQLIAEELVAAMRQGYPQLARDPGAILIGLTTEDIYIRQARWQFAFSWREDDRFAVVSSARMRIGVSAATPGLLESRLRKMVTKNIGVMHYRLPLSDHPRSVMYRNVGGLEELDAMGEDY